MIPYRKTVWASCICLFIAGCGGGSPGSGPGNAATPQAVLLRGHVHGGQSPVAASAVTLYTVNPGAAASVVTTAQTDSMGDFTLNFTCSSPGLSNNSLLYITSTGGNPGGGNNDALGEMVALGACGSLPAFANISEVTTVAAAYALSGFATVSGTAPNLTVNVQASSTNTTGIANAFATAAALADAGTGVAPTALGTSQAPAQQTLYSLANAVAACVNTTGGGSAQCSELFACAVPGAAFDGTSACGGGTSIAPADTISAALSVAHNPGLVSIAGVYDAATRNAVFSPALGGAPNDWTLGLNFTGAGLNAPSGLAIDASGDVWIGNSGGSSVTELTPTGLPVTGSPFTNGGVVQPAGIAIDASGDVWVSNTGGTAGSVVKLDASGAPVTGSPFTGGGLYNPLGIAIDASGDAWISDFGSKGGGITELTSTGAPVAGSPFTGGGIKTPTGIAIDASGNVWATDYKYETVSELNSSGSPVPGSPFASGVLGPFSLAINASGDVWIGNFIPNNTTTGITELTSAGVLVTGSPFTGGGINEPEGIAIDASGDVWAANASGSSITELDSSGSPRSPGTGFVSGQPQGPANIAVDASGNVWTANEGGNSVTELVGAAAPTRTPLVTHIMPGGGFAP